MRIHCTALAVTALVVTAATAGAQQQTQPATGNATFAIFLRGTQIGREQASLARTESGWIITSSGRSEAPLDFTITRFEVKYAADWQPLEMTLEARVRNSGIVVKTSFAMTTAINEILQNNVTRSKEDQISARTIVLPNQVFAAAEALAVRLWDAAPGAELPVYVAPAAEIKVKVRAVTSETLKGPTGSLATRRFDLTFQNPDRPLNVAVIVDERLRLVRYEVPDAGLLAVREDLSSVAVRAQAVRNPTDTDVAISANGFNLAGTMTTPSTVAGRLRYPAVLLVGGTSPADRDQTIGGVAVFAQLAKMLAESGHVVLRYDRRGTGQSGGRTDSATLGDYADDASAAVKWLKDRDDVDKRHLIVVGHMDGGAAALLAASRNNEIDGVVTIDASGSSGADFILLQQQKLLEDLKLSNADRQARIEMQKKIQRAVVSGTDWEGVPEPMRRQADTPWFKSVLTYEPAAVLMKVKQPMLILHADLDPSVPPSEADKLGDLAKGRKKAPPSEVVHFADLTHALTASGSNTVSPKAADAIASWIKKQ
jgi:pimeloyl-ACP methyl ester carboxylesterase